jgi:hypothetical protein
VVNVFDKDLLFLRRLDKTGKRWESYTIPHPSNCGSGKAVTIGDVDRDGKPDLMLAFANADNKSGLVWLSCAGKWSEGPWTRHEVSGPAGVKFDLAPLIDLDGDGDLDVLNTEEVTQLGIIWYENPHK